MNFNSYYYKISTMGEFLKIVKMKDNGEIASVVTNIAHKIFS